MTVCSRGDYFFLLHLIVPGILNSDTVLFIQRTRRIFKKSQGFLPVFSGI